MDKPKLGDGYTQIANSILEAFAKIRISGEARQVLDIIIRKTYGFKKKSDYISYSQFAKTTGLCKPTVVRALRKLVLLNLVVIQKDNNYNLFTFNKYFTTWRPLAKKSTTFKREPFLKPFCYLCGFTEILHKHHIIPMLQGGKNNMKNKINLCPNCHSLAHKGKYSAKELLSKKIIVEKIIQKDNDLGKPSLSKKINPITTKESITKDTLTKDNGLSKDNLFLDLIPDGLQTEKFIRDWKKWIAWRKEDRHTLKRTTAKRQLKMLNSQPDPIAVLKKSLDNGYQGLFPLKAPQQFHPKSNVAKGKYDNV